MGRLEWNLEKIADRETVCFIEDEDGARMNPVTSVLIELTMAIRLGSITEANAAEFYARVKLAESIHGPLIMKSGGVPYRITPEDVQAHIGLYVNVSNESRARFLSSLGADVTRDVNLYKRKIAAKKVAETMEEVA